MEKVTEKWFKEHGWKKYEYKDKMYDDQPGYDNTIKHHTIFSFDSNGITARWDCIVYITPPGRYNKKKRIERFYAFYARGKNGFQVENRISHRRFSVTQIEAALKLCGIE